MILIGGISDGIKELFYKNRVYCRYCGERAAIRILMTYTCFTFFFIPIFKWNRRFFVEFGCCGRQYELTKEVGMRILHGEDVEIESGDLTPTGQRRENWQKDYGSDLQDTQNIPVKTEDTPAPANEAALLERPAKIQAPKKEDRSEKRYCPHCGKEIHVTFQYCPYCGGKL